MTLDGVRVFPLQPPPAGTLRRTMVTIGLLLSPLVLGLAFLGRAESALAVLGVLVLISAILQRFVVAARRATVTLSDSGLQLHAPLARDHIRWTALHPEHARLVDLAVERDLAPRWREMGLGLSGWRSGWFRLRGGRSALVALADGARPVLVPWGGSGLLLLTPRDPEGFLAALAERGAVSAAP